jgi:hypothetical protein
MLETPIFIKVPSVYFVKLPDGQWLNLALIRSVQPGDRAGKIVVAWETGEFDIYFDAETAAILEALAETTYIDKSEVKNGATS